MTRDKFGVDVKEGTNLKTLKKAQAYFSAEKQITIINYKYTTDSNKSRRFVDINGSDAKICKICDTSLYYIENSSTENPSDVRIRQKKKLIFVDNLGTEHHCCYKLQSCLDRVGFSDRDIEIPTRVPTFFEFLNINQDEAENNRQLFDDAKSSYEKVVVPFLQKWSNLPINKQNLQVFLSDFSIIDRHLIYYEDERAKAKICEKIYNMIGVKL